MIHCTGVAADMGTLIFLYQSLLNFETFRLIRASNHMIHYDGDIYGGMVISHGHTKETPRWVLLIGNRSWFRGIAIRSITSEPSRWSRTNKCIINMPLSILIRNKYYTTTKYQYMKYATDAAAALSLSLSGTGLSVWTIAGEDCRYCSSCKSTFGLYVSVFSSWWTAAITVCTLYACSTIDYQDTFFLSQQPVVPYPLIVVDPPFHQQRRVCFYYCVLRATADCVWLLSFAWYYSILRSSKLF